MKVTWLPLRGCFSLVLLAHRAIRGTVYRPGALRGIPGARGWNTWPPIAPANFRRRCDAKRALESHAAGMAPHDQRDPWALPRRAVWRINDDGTSYCCNESVAKDEQRRCRAAIRRARHRGGRAAARATARRECVPVYWLPKPRISVINARRRQRVGLPF